ncbi:hypothetical protein ABT010_17695 [Streptomyces sp. NPDC002668]|uniref:hypothetical protein n=1 Tax=Streptomyces sp. NPDC002668 TaxID=3154422 RepID=UPI003319A1AB
MAPVVAFGVGLWLAGSVFSGWLPRGEAERWAVAAAFATVAAGAAGAPLAWWAGRETGGGGQVVQRATATEASRTTQIGGSRGGTASAPSVDVEQQAESSGTARITQIGGDQHTGGR